MSAQRTSFLLPILAILGSIAFLCTGTSWAKHSLFPEIGAQGTRALRLAYVDMQGHRLRFKTIDLMGSAEEFERQLLSLATDFS